MIEEFYFRTRRVAIGPHITEEKVRATVEAKNITATYIDIHHPPSSEHWERQRRWLTWWVASGRRVRKSQNMSGSWEGRGGEGRGGERNRGKRNSEQEGRGGRRSLKA